MKESALLAVLTLVVAGAGALIAYNQFRIAEANLRLALFEKRYAVYQATLAFLRTVLGDCGASLQPHIEFGALTIDAEFLFDEDLMGYLRSINARAAHAAGISRSSDEERARRAAELSADLQWLADQALELPVRFRPYMRFAQWRLQRPLYLRGIDWVAAQLRRLS